VREPFFVCLPPYPTLCEMKAVCTLILLGLALCSAASVAEKLKTDIEAAQISSSVASSISSAFSSSSSAIPATRLESVSGSGSGSGSGSSGCIDANPCAGASLGGGAGAEKTSVEDAVAPVDAWLKDFKKRSLGDGSDLYAAAKATVRPLLQKLKRSQKKAQLKLQESNGAILRHVEEVTTAHVYALLKADAQKTKVEERKEEQAAKIIDAKSAQKEANDKLNAQLGLSSSQAAALDSALKSTGVAPSQSVVNSIAKLISSESSSAMKQLSSALKTAMSESGSKF